MFCISHVSTEMAQPEQSGLSINETRRWFQRLAVLRRLIIDPVNLCGSPEIDILRIR